MFLHQTTTEGLIGDFSLSCMLSCSYIKPQHHLHRIFHHSVVCYHVPTSNHNSCSANNVARVLYVIMFLHQTTTHLCLLRIMRCCMLSCSYIKPQPDKFSINLSWVVCYHVPTSNHNAALVLNVSSVLYVIMFLHQTTTMYDVSHLLLSCMLSCSYIKPQLDCNHCSRIIGCMLSCSYIKPQHVARYRAKVIVVCYHVPTSNHNLKYRSC